MMKKIILAFLLVLIPLSVSAEEKVKCAEPDKKDLAAGMKIVAQWKGDNWYVGTVKKKTGEFIEVTYTDNTSGIKKAGQVVAHPDVLYPNKVAPCFKSGDMVVSTWKGNSWWKGKVDKVTADIVELTYSDGEKGIHRVYEMVRLPQ